MSSLVRHECAGGVVWYDGDHAVRIDSWRGRLLAARMRVPKPTFTHYIRHDTWHVCHYTQYLPADSDQWIEVTW